MATTNDLHKQESTSKYEKMFSDEDLNNIYKYENILNSKSESLENKIKALITTWGELTSLTSCPTKENLKTLTEFLKSHTLNIVLSASWLKYQDTYYMRLWNSIISCSNTYNNYKGFQTLCRKLASITKSPWGKPTILSMLNSHYHTIHIDDYNFFVHEESGYFISMRLKKLCEDKCEDLALNLTRAYIKCCEWADSNGKSMFISDDQKKFVFDVYLALLYKFNYKQEMSVLLKSVSIAEGIDMVRRFIFKLVSVSRIWLNSICIAQFAGTVFLTRIVMKPIDEARGSLLELLNVWLPLYEKESEVDNLLSDLRITMKNAISASHMYIILGQLGDKFGDKIRKYSVEICIQALNTDLNLLEKIKTESDKVREEAEITGRLADGLLKLADIFKNNILLARECVLSSFSLRPTESCLRQIEYLARASGYEVLDTGQWLCRFHPPESEDDELLVICNSCGQYMCELEFENSQPNIGLTDALNTNNMGLCQQLNDDLVVIIFCSRYQLLSWIHKWKHLHRLCAMYLNDPNGTKNLITELKYLDIDYTPFLLKREMDVYEHESQEVDYIDDLLDESFHSRKRKRSESPIDEPFPILNTKSDPDVLKTLRSFRRTLKSKAVPETPSCSMHVADSQSNTPSISLPIAQNPEQIKQENMSIDRPSPSGIQIRHDLFDCKKDFHFYSNDKKTLNGPLDTFEDFFKQLINKPPTTITPNFDNFNKMQGSCDIIEVSNNLNNADSSPDSPVKMEYGQSVRNNNINTAINPCYIGDKIISESQYKINTAGSTKEINKNITEASEIQKTNDINVLKPNIISHKVEETVPMSETLDFFEVPPGQVHTSEVGKFKPEELDTVESINSLENVSEHLADVSSDEQTISDSMYNNPSFQEKSNGIIKSIDEDVANKVINECVLNNDTELSSDNEKGTDVDIEQTVNSIKETSQSLQSKYKLKECCVVLNRLAICSKLEKGSYRKVVTKHKKRGRKSKAISDNDSSLRENQVQSEERCKDENYNSRFSSPLQNKNQRVLSPNNIESVLEELKKKLLVCPDKMNPRVLLMRLEDSRVKSLLARVPGISDTKLFLPENTNRIVNVVQIAGGRTTSTVPAPNTQTSTQVSPHIQRIGQPRNEKNDQATNSEATTSTNTKSANTYTIAKPVATQSPTLINILSQQVRPSQSNNVRSRTGPLINILSSHSIKAANVTVASKTTTTTVTSDSQVNTPRIIATTTEQQQIINQIVNPGRTTGQIKHVVGTSNSEQGRIVQFICKSTDGKLIPVTSFPSNRLVKVGSTPAVSTTPDSPNLEDNVNKLVSNKKTDCELSETLPKFQQAFGKSVYQNKVEGTNITNNTNNANADADKTKMQPKNSSVNLQPIQGGVIYTRQMPVGQTINLIPQTRAQVFRIATTNADQISLVKDTVIHSKMSALLAAALQGKPKAVESTVDSENNTDNNNVSTTTATRVQIRPTLVQNARIVKPVIQIPSNVIRNTPQANLSSTTLEQLREFDMVYKQVKERSSTSTPSDNNVVAENDSPPQRISVTYLNQGQKLNCAPVVVVSSYSNLQPAASPALSVASHGSSSPCVTPAPASTSALPKVTAKSSKGKSVKNSPSHASKISPIPKPQQKPQEDEHTTQRIFDILAEYAEQLRNSPDLNNKPAPRRRSNPPTNPSQNSKRKKSSSSKKSGQCSSLSTDIDIDDPRTIGSEDSSCGVVQLSVQDEEQTPTAASTSESNDSTITTRQQLILTDSSHNQTRNLIIADSSVGEALKMPNTAVLVPGNYIMPVSMVKGGQQIAVMSGGSKILATVPARSGPNMLLFQSFLNQNRKSNVPTVKYSTIQPISGISSQTLTGVSAQPPVILPPPSHSINTVTLGQPIAIKKIDDSDRVNTELLLTISQSRENNCTTSDDTPQPDSSTSIVKIENVDIDENTAMSDNSSEKAFTYQKTLITTPIATPVIAQNIKDDYDEQSECTTQSIMTLNINSLDSKGDIASKTEERVQSVLVTAGSSNGPMLSHSPPQYKQSDCNSNTEQSKDDFLRNSGKRSEKVTNAVYCLQGKKKVTGAGRLDREVQQICLQRRQAAIERELRLQKTLSEECEDLGVDEPSTSDLFPEALLFDSNNSPSFDQTSQDLIKRSAQSHDKEETKLTLFSDDDFMFEPVQYQAGDAQLCYEEVVDSRLITNGQSTRSPSEDNTLLQTCTSMSDVTLSSPISPDTYRSNTPPPLNKYMHKYTNKKKSDRPKQVDSWPAEVSSSEDTTGSNELIKCSESPDICLNKRSDEELSDGGNFKVVRLSISKSDCAGDVHCSDDVDCLSGRGARKSVKKKCPCCNGADDNAISRKRPSTHQHTTNPHKKAFPNKKR